MKIYLTICIFALLFSLTGATAAQQELHVGNFENGDLTGWKEQTIWNSNKTSYSFLQKNGKKILMAKSNNSASGLIHKMEVDSKAYPIIKWSWKIDHTVKKGNERVKEGHDFAARVYVVFSRGLFSRTRAIEYVWGNVMHKGEILRSPYSSNAVMIAVDSGEELAGQWTSHKRNYYEDYRAAFGEEAPKLGAVAIMTDSDNSHESAVGYYGDISLLSSDKEEFKTKDPKNNEAAPKEQLHKDSTPKETAPKNQLNSVQPATTATPQSPKTAP